MLYIQNGKECAWLAASAKWAASMPWYLDAVFHGDSAYVGHAGILTEMGQAQCQRFKVHFCRKHANDEKST